MMSQVQLEVVDNVKVSVANFTPYTGTVVLAMSIHILLLGVLAYPEKTPPEKTAGVMLGTRSTMASSSPLTETTLSYWSRSV